MNHGRLTLFFPFFIAFLLRGCPVHAQTPQRTANLQFHLDVPINFILPDPKGFLWLATDKGLIRYDGSTTETYTHDPQNPASLPTNNLKYLLRDDKTGLIWIATNNEGLTCFDPKLPKNKAFTTYPSIPNDTTTVGGNVLNTLAMDKNGRIWIGGDGAVLTELDPKTRKFTRHPEFGTDATIYSLSTGENGNLWIGTRDNGLVLYNTHQRKILKQWSYEKEVEKSVKGFDKNINIAAHVLVAPDNQSAWFIYVPLGLIYIDFKTDEKEVYTLGFKPFDVAKLNNMMQIERDEEGKLWVSHADEGVVVFNPKTRQVEGRLTEESELVMSKMPMRVKNVYADKRTHQTWIATTKGLFSYSPEKNIYTQSTPLIIGASKALKVNKIIEIRENLLNKERNVWILTDKEVLKMDGLTQITTQRFPLPAGIETNEWSGFHIQPSGVYLRSVNHLSRIDEQSGKITPLPLAQDINGFVDDTLANGEPIHWVSTYNAGLFRIRQNGKIENFQHLPSNALLAIYRTPDGVIWVSADNAGLVRLKDKENVGFDHFFNNPQIQNSLPDNILVSFFTDSKKRLWIGSASNGLVWVDNPNAKTPVFRQYSINKTENPFISTIQEDSDNNLWTTTKNAQPYVFNPTTHESLLLKGNGGDILPNKLMDKTVFGEGRGGVWLANTEGVYFIDRTQKYLFPKRALPIFFTGLTVFDKDETARLTDSTVQLSYRENFFSLKFSAINFDGNTQYRYKLEGIDKDWVRVGSQNTANYTDLQNGTYTFRVRASIGLEADDDRETRLQIVITPPFWRTWWFRLGLIVSFFGMIFWFAENRLKQIKFAADLKQKEAEIKQKEAETAQLRAEFQQKIAETELAALRAQMNPHFIFNCLNSLNLYILENNIDLASDYLQRFSKLIRLVLENSRLERIPLSNEIEALRLYMLLESMRFKEKLQFSIEIDPEIDVEMVEIPPLLLQPFIENAIWHGLMHRVEGGSILLKISQLDDKIIHAEIIDNGIGRSAAALIKSKSATLQKSFGMKVTSERIAAINQIYHTATKVEVFDLVNNKGEACGTKVVVEIPI
jgi:ligand-binding sensor domain-containing protein/signal transduction histidine kinase